MLYIPKFFKIQELVPQHVYNERGDKAWELLDPLLLDSADAIRRMFGPMTVNNWHVGGSREWSGLRTEHSPYGTMYSQHRFGRALDMIPHDVPVDVVRKYIVDNSNEFPLITGIELDVNWLHIDVRNSKGVKLFGK